MLYFNRYFLNSLNCYVSFSGLRSWQSPLNVAGWGTFLSGPHDSLASPCADIASIVRDSGNGRGGASCSALLALNRSSISKNAPGRVCYLDG